MAKHFRLAALWFKVIPLVLFLSTSAVGQSYDIYVVNVNTGTVVQATDIPDAGEYNPHWSTNCRRLAHDVVGGPAPLGHAIYITDIQTGVSVPLAGAEGGNDAAWSPNGSLIAFDRFPVGDPSIYIVPSCGGTSTLVRTDAVEADWSPNCKRLVFRQFSDGSIRTVDKHGGTETIVVQSGSNPVWSPDGNWIAYSVGDGIWKIRVNSQGEPIGSPLQVISDPGYYDGQPSWSADSRTIVFHSNRESGDFDIWTIPACGGRPTRLTGLVGAGDYDPSFSANGEMVAYAGFTFTALSKDVSASEFSGSSTFTLDQNYPNPFNPSTTISYGLPEGVNVSLKVYDVVGEEVLTLVDEHVQAGYHQVTFDATSLASGIYFYKLTAGPFSAVKKFHLVK